MNRLAETVSKKDWGKQGKALSFKRLHTLTQRYLIIKTVADNLLRTDIA
jgi:hypothetical protein